MFPAVFLSLFLFKMFFNYLSFLSSLSSPSYSSSLPFLPLPLFLLFFLFLIFLFFLFLIFLFFFFLFLFFLFLSSSSFLPLLFPPSFLPLPFFSAFFLLSGSMGLLNSSTATRMGWRLVEGVRGLHCTLTVTWMEEGRLSANHFRTRFEWQLQRICPVL